jgi:hypothetical protein
MTLSPLSETFTTYSAHITGVVVLITESNEVTGVKRTVASETCPNTFVAADTFLAVHSFRRTQDWELGEAGMVSAPLERMDNRFNGTVAARLDQAVGTTHEEFAPMSARELACSELDGWLISDSEITEVYVVAGSSLDGDVVKIHMVGEGQDWSQRYTGHFMPGQFVWVAKRIK